MSLRVDSAETSSSLAFCREIATRTLWLHNRLGRHDPDAVAGHVWFRFWQTYETNPLPDQFDHRGIPHIALVRTIARRRTIDLIRSDRFAQLPEGFDSPERRDRLDDRYLYLVSVTSFIKRLRRGLTPGQKVICDSYLQGLSFFEIALTHKVEPECVHRHFNWIRGRCAMLANEYSELKYQRSS